jgi:two-component system, sensor histidine kinase
LFNTFNVIMLESLIKRYRYIITKEADILNRARIGILVQGLLSFFVMGVVLLTLCIIRQHVFSLRIFTLMIIFAAGLGLLLASISWRVITHLFILCVSYLLWSNLIFYNLYFLVALQYILIIVVSSYYILGSRWGMIYSICNTLPFVVVILRYVLINTRLLEEVSNGLAFSVILVFNFTLLISIHYHFFKAFRESSDKEKTLFADLETSLYSLRLLMEKKDEFLGIAAHELRTPITSMKASLQSLLRLVSRKETLKESLPLVEIANRQVTKLGAIVNDLVDVNRIQSGKLKLNQTIFPLNVAISDCIAEIGHQAKGYNIIVEQLFDGDIFADKARIEQVLINLLSNAIKYSPIQRNIYVSIESDDIYIKVSIIDEGIGIPADKLPFVFYRFFRVHESSQVFSGLGLGLFISAEIIKQHNGKIGVKSKEDEGSVFWFTLPKKINC